MRIAGEQALDLGADLLLIYYGHNEVAQFTQLTRFAQVRPGRLAARQRLRQSALYSLLARHLAPAGAATASPPARPPDREDLDRLKALAVHSYRHSLDQLLRAARRQGADVVLMSPATNYPFVELTPHDEDSGDRSALDEAHALRGGGERDAALARATAAAAAAPTGSAIHLEALRLRAELLAEAGRPEAARQAMREAIDASARPGVMTSAVRGALEDLAAQHGVPLLDVDRLFYARSVDGLNAPGLFWDDLHPTREGHRMIAEALLPVTAAIAEEELRP